MGEHVDIATNATVPNGIGSRAHLRETLARARRAVETARERIAVSRDLLARAHATCETSSRLGESAVAQRAQLRASVTGYVRRLRADGTPPERMLVLVKSAVREATLDGAEVAAEESRALLEDVVRWSIEAYYDAA